jgi:hypothetical protein
MKLPDTIQHVGSARPGDFTDVTDVDDFRFGHFQG